MQIIRIYTSMYILTPSAFHICLFFKSLKLSEFLSLIYRLALALIVRIVMIFMRLSGPGASCWSFVRSAGRGGSAKR